MSFRPATLLRTATSRAKSDVANKLVSMLLHEISREITEAHGAPAVTSESYASSVERAFGNACLYCARPLERNSTVVEHLDGMNRFRLGLHVPGNAALACKACNSQKRGDDQRAELILAGTGWESFLSHDGTRCGLSCKSCAYWRDIIPDAEERRMFLAQRREAVARFRRHYLEILAAACGLRESLRGQVTELYRACQDFASKEISALKRRVLS